MYVCKHYIQERDLDDFVKTLKKEFSFQKLNVEFLVNPAPCYFGAMNGALRHYTHLLMIDNPLTNTSFPLARGVISDGIYEFDVNTEISPVLWHIFDKICFSYL